MFSFIKNWFGKDRDDARSLEELKKEIQEESIVEAEELQEAGNTVTAAETADKPAPAPKKERKKVKTELSLHPLWEEMLDSEKKYALRFLQADLPEMVVGTVGVTGFSLIPADGGITVAMFFRNGTVYPVRFKTITLSVYLDDRLFARHTFNMEELGAIPSNTSRPWEVFFPADSFVSDNFAFSRWKVKLHVGKSVYQWPRELDLDPAMEAKMSDMQKNRLEYIMQVLPPIKKNTVEVTGFDIVRMKDGRLVVAMLFQNATDRVYSPKKLDITIKDPDGSVIAEGLIQTDKIHVRPGTSKPWIMVFPPELVKKPDTVLRHWALIVK
ncbi:MAG TPA: SLAP domain-containing protein [Candidatus Bathyarchaeia archaeon]|nr:SLAP domain-containing protein [Candidatus Bathyarchaeia archaeon]